MAVDQKHPDLNFWEPIWKQMRATEMGEEAVKEQKELWLPRPSGFSAMKDGGESAYKAYLARAQFPDILQPTLQGMVGVIHRVEAQIQGLEEGKPLAYLWERATKDDSLPLEVFHRRITTEILLMGRYEILVDVPSDGSGLPYFVGYATEQLLNWSEYARDLFVLNESRKVLGGDGFDEFEWREERRYRVLRLENGVYTQQTFVNNVDVGSGMIIPVAKGNVPLNEIPIVVVGPRELTVRNIDPPPLKGVSSASLAIYRLDADYRHQMFMTGQETLFIIGEQETVPSVVGSGVVHGLPPNSDAKYVGPSGVGIEAHRTAIMDARQDAVAAGVKLFDTQAKAESGEALRLRASAQTATLTTIAQCSAAALEKVLRYAATFVGQNPEEIVVKPNLTFVDTTLDPQNAVYLMQLWQGGAISKETLYENLQKGDIASAERTFDEEQSLIDKEAIDNPVSAGMNLPLPGGGGNIALLKGPSNTKTKPGNLSRFIESGKNLKVK